jgi:hypothetical protein
MISTQVELYTPEDKEAFAAFLTASAAADRSRPKDEGYGGIASATVGWQNRATGEQTADEGTSTSEQSDLSAETTDAPKRERGKAAQGRARRTKEEIAEDEAADKADAAAASAGAETGAEVADRQISTSPEDRHDPNNPDDVADAADEAAETAAAKAETGNKLTHDDVRNALGAYVKAYGMPAAQEDGPKVITLMFGEGKSKVSDIPDTQEDLAKAVAGIKEMTTKNPYSRAADL